MRQFNNCPSITASVRLLALGAAAICFAAFAGAIIAAEGPADLRFRQEGASFAFDTGLLRGTLREDGRSLGLMPVFAAKSGERLSNEKLFGVFSYYRLLDSNHRYGAAGWAWKSEATLAPDGSVAARWTADAEHPFDLFGVYRWTGPGTLDLQTTVVAHQALPKFEVFLASYFSTLTSAYGYAAACPETGGKDSFLEATEAIGRIHLFPRDKDSLQIARDGRWLHPPDPIEEWTIRPQFALPLGLRRDAKSGWTALVMAPPTDCFAVCMIYGADWHHSTYLSLLGRDLANGETATVRARLVMGRDISDERAVELYQEYAKTFSPAR